MIKEIKEHFVGLCLFGLLILILICGAFIWELNKKIENQEIKIKLEIPEEQNNTTLENL